MKTLFLKLEVFKSFLYKSVLIKMIALQFIATTIGCKQEQDHTDLATPEDIKNELVAGNERFLTNNFKNQNFKNDIKHTQAEQHPYALVLSCMDSRVPPEIIFDQGIGRIFVNRVAGNLEDENIIGSIEYAVNYKKIKLLVVLGHTNCGAIQGTLDNVKLGKLTQLTGQIEESFTNNEAQHHVALNVNKTINDILDQSTLVRQQTIENKIKIVGAFYDVTTGKVYFL